MGSTETTERIGKTRSVAAGLKLSSIAADVGARAWSAKLMFGRLAKIPSFVGKRGGSCREPVRRGETEEADESEAAGGGSFCIDLDCTSSRPEAIVGDAQRI